MHYYTRLYSADHSLRSPVKRQQPTTPQPPFAPASIVAAPLATTTTPLPHGAGGAPMRERSGRRNREVYVAPPRPVTLPSPDASAAVARLEEEVHSMSRKLEQFVSSMSAAAAPPPPLVRSVPPPHPPQQYSYEASHSENVYHPAPQGPYAYYPAHQQPSSDAYHDGRFYAARYGPPQLDAHYPYYSQPAVAVPPPAPPPSSFLSPYTSASSLGWYHTQVLPDPQDVAASLYGGRRSPPHYHNGSTTRVIPPRPQLSPLRPHTTSPSRHVPALPLPIVEIPPPPVMPSYPPARDDVQAVASSYAWLALRNLMRDVEDAERQERIRILEEELLNLDTLHEAKRELVAVRERERKRERLAALDAEALLRHHLSNVARGELHRERVTEDLLVSHVERESSPEGQYARSVLQERSYSPMPPSDRRTTRPTRSDVADDYDEGYVVSATMPPPSPTRSRRSTLQQPSPYAVGGPDASTIARRPAAAVSFVSSSSPLPAASSQRHYAAGARTPGRSTPLAELSEALGYNAAIQRDVAAAEAVATEAEHSRARRSKKKMLMLEALR